MVRRICRIGAAVPIPIVSMRMIARHRAPALLGLGYALLTAACASTGGTPRPFPTTAPHPKPAEPAVATDTEGRTHASDYELIGTALALRGVPYKNGGTDLTGF